MESDLSLDCDAFEPFSAPVDSYWLKLFAQKREVIVVGSGVTAAEYTAIFRRASINFRRLDPSMVDDEAFDQVLDGSDVVLIATPRGKVEVQDSLSRKGLIERVNFYTYLYCLRNRAVFDFKSGIEFNLLDSERVSKRLKSMPTLAGCDYILGQLEATRVNLVNLLVVSLRSLHTKYTAELTNFNTAFVKDLVRPDVLEIIVRKQICPKDVIFVKEYISDNRGIHVHAMFVDCEVQDYPIFDSYERQEFHPSYYDEELLAKATIPNSEKRKMCLSRRLFPIFDSRLKLKLCSLFGSVASSDLDIDQVNTKKFSSNRNRLCIRCSSREIHRL